MFKKRLKLSSTNNKWTMGEWDFFAEPVALNFKGQTKVGSVAGIACTILVWIILCGYAILQFIKLVSKDNPTITFQTQFYHFTNSDSVNLD